MLSRRSLAIRHSQESSPPDWIVQAFAGYFNHQFKVSYVKEDTKNALVGFAVLSFIGGFFFPPLFAVGVLLLVVPALQKGEFARHARRIHNENRLRLISSHLMRPIQVQLDVAKFNSELGKELQDPDFARTHGSIEIKLPPDNSPVDPLPNINKHLAQLASLLPTNAELASQLAQTQKECASELRRVRDCLQVDPALLQIFRSLKIFDARETLDALKVFSSLGEPAKGLSHSLARELGEFESLLETGPQSLLIRDDATEHSDGTTV